jgi:hypothetical protein
MASTDSWSMPQPRLGDVVLFSKDSHTFDKPSVGFVTAVGDSTISISVLTVAGLTWQTSVHHKDDPALRQDNGWEDLGVWDFTDLTKAIYAAAASKNTADTTHKVK